MNFDLKAHTILLTIAGSRAYGMHTDESDVDLKGVAIPPAGYLLGCLNNFEQADSPSHMEPFANLLSLEERRAVEATKLEGAVYALNKFCKLAMDGNPNILDALFCREEDVRWSTPWGDQLRGARDLFISAKCKHTFSGYAFQQLKRIKLHRRWLLDPPAREPAREDFGVFEGIEQKQVKAALAAVNKAIDCWELDLGRFDKSERVQVTDGIADYLAQLSITADDRWKAAARSIGYSENFLEILERERQYKTAREDWHKFRSWKKNRNRDRSELEARHGYDTKHGAHLFRLMRMAEEILLTGKVNVWREDREEILAVRRGEWSYDQIVDWAETTDVRLSEIYSAKAYTIRHAPNRAAINALCHGLTVDYLRLG